MMDNKQNAGDGNTGYWNAGNRNTGNRNAGNGNTGNRNAGNGNTGYWNAGNRNAGDGNAGNRNTGYWNAGNRNAGDGNTGNRNAGDWNTGNRNAGNWNAGDWNTGYLNTGTPKLRIFNKETNVDIDGIIFPDFFYFNMTVWVDERDMTKTEKENHDQYKVTGGYLKIFEYKEAWRASWDNAPLEDRKKVLDLPNWNNEVFKEISGIDVEKELGTTNDSDVIELNGRKYKAID